MIRYIWGGGEVEQLAFSKSIGASSSFRRSPPLSIEPSRGRGWPRREGRYAMSIEPQRADMTTFDWLRLSRVFEWRQPAPFPGCRPLYRHTERWKHRLMTSPLLRWDGGNFSSLCLRKGTAGVKCSVYSVDLLSLGKGYAESRLDAFSRSKIDICEIRIYTVIQ